MVTSREYIMDQPMVTNLVQSTGNKSKYKMAPMWKYLRIKSLELLKAYEWKS
jgi:hypothetical protein